jgi:hypothetical protein
VYLGASGFLNVGAGAGGRDSCLGNGDIQGCGVVYGVPEVPPGKPWRASVMGCRAVHLWSRQAVALEEGVSRSCLGRLVVVSVRGLIGHPGGLVRGNRLQSLVLS